MTNNYGVDIVFEHVADATCGLFAKQLPIMGSYTGTTGELPRAARLFFAGQLKPVRDRTFPLAAAAAALIRLEQLGRFGNIVLEV